MRVFNWVIWYNDWTHFSDEKGTWNQAPDDNVAGVMLYLNEVQPGTNKPFRRYMSGDDWYFSDGELVFAHNKDSLEANERRYPEFSFKRGKWTDDENYHAINEFAYTFEQGPPSMHNTFSRP
tara:strand:- start:4596 stop:4961 length:366 start_codon:yes stop_codon:yes gene_type:complete